MRPRIEVEVLGRSCTAGHRLNPKTLTFQTVSSCGSCQYALAWDGKLVKRIEVESKDKKLVQAILGKRAFDAH